jgi:hypothetical protein
LQFDEWGVMKCFQYGFFPGGTPMATAQFGNLSFAAGTGFFPSLFGLQFVCACFFQTSIETRNQLDS